MPFGLALWSTSGELVGHRPLHVQFFPSGLFTGRTQQMVLDSTTLAHGVYASFTTCQRLRPVYAADICRHRQRPRRLKRLSRAAALARPGHTRGESDLLCDGTSGEHVTTALVDNNEYQECAA